MITYGLTGTVYIHDAFGTGEMVPLGSVSDAELTEETDKNDKELADRYLSTAPISGSFTVTPRFSARRFDAFLYYIWTGNNLYLKFPKKMKRSRGITRLKNSTFAQRIFKEAIACPSGSRRCVDSKNI